MAVNVTPQIFLDTKGDIQAAKTLVRFALNQMSILNKLMTFNELKQDQRKIELSDGSRIAIQNCFGISKIYISCPKTSAIKEEIEDTTELVEIYTPGIGYSYWDPKNDKLIMIPGYGNIKSDTFLETSMFDFWYNSLLKEHEFYGRTETVNGKFYIIISAYIQTWKNLKVTTKWFVWPTHFINHNNELVECKKPQFWTSLKSTTPEILPGELRFEVEDHIPNYAEEEYFIKLTISPYVPLYATGKVTAAAAFVMNEHPDNIKCYYPDLIEFGTKPGFLQYYLCGHRDTAYVVKPMYKYSDGGDDKGGVDYFPWDNDYNYIDDDIEGTFNYSYDPMSCSGATASTSISSATSVLRYEYVSVNKPYLNGRRSLFSDSLITVTEKYTQTINEYDFHFEPVYQNIVAEIIGCNDGEITANSYHICTFSEITNNTVISSVESAFGLLISEQQEEIVHTGYGVPNAGSSSVIDFSNYTTTVTGNVDISRRYTGIQGICSRNTILTVAVGYNKVDSNEEIHIYCPGGWYKGKTFNRSPVGLPQSSVLKTKLKWISQIRLVLLPANSISIGD